MDGEVELTHTDILGKMGDGISKLWYHRLVMPAMPSTKPPSFIDSIGRQINHNFKMSRRQVWLARGSALQKYHEEILPAVQAFLDTLGLECHVDNSIRLYMVGHREKSAKPILMICCSDEVFRNTVVERIRDSALLEGYPGFGLECSALPLGCSKTDDQIGGLEDSVNPLDSTPTAHTSDDRLPMTSRESPEVTRNPLGPSIIASPISPGSLTRSKGMASMVSGHYSTTGKAFAVTLLPQLGRRIYCDSTSRDQPLQYATGGVVLQIEGLYYQLTVKHLCLRDKDGSPEALSSADLSYCSLDRQSDEDDSDISDSEDEVGITSRGSGSPRSVSNTDEDSDGYTTQGCSLVSDQIAQGGCQASSESMEQAAETANPTAPGVRDLGTQHGNHHYLQHLEVPPIIPADQTPPCNALCIGSLPVDTSVDELKDVSSKLRYAGYILSQDGPTATLDYAFVPVECDLVRGLGQELNKVPTQTPLHVTNVGKVSPEERRVIAVTASVGPVRGLLAPSAIIYKGRGTPKYQRIYQVQLDIAPREGDCGSAVVDEETGSLYGHIILGNPTACLAYIVPAIDVFEDIRQSLAAAVTIPTSDGVSSDFDTTQTTMIDLSGSLFKRDDYGSFGHYQFNIDRMSGDASDSEASNAYTGSNSTTFTYPDDDKTTIVYSSNP